MVLVHSRIENQCRTLRTRRKIEIPSQQESGTKGRRYGTGVPYPFLNIQNGICIKVHVMQERQATMSYYRCSKRTAKSKIFHKYSNTSQNGRKTLVSYRKGHSALGRMSKTNKQKRPMSRHIIVKFLNTWVKERSSMT